MYNLLSQFMEWTAWEMTKPKPYGPFHLFFTFVGFALSVFLAWKLRNSGKRANKVILLTVGLILLFSEVYKQLFYYFYIGEGSYQWWIFPFQLCSVPMYLCLIAPLLKPCKLSHGMYSFMMIYNLLGGFMAFVEPSGIVHGYWTLTLHAFIWHMLLVFVGLYIGFSGRGGWETKDYWIATKTFLGLCVVAFAINLLFWDVSEGTINMFFLGPKDSSLAVFKDIAKNFGWYVSTALYIPAVCLGSYIFFVPFHCYWKKRQGSLMIESQR